MTPGGGFFPTGQRRKMVLPRRCKYCRSTLEQIVLERGEDFNLSADATVCPRCDAPSPPRPLGTDPNEPAVPSD